MRNEVSRCSVVLISEYLPLTVYRYWHYGWAIFAALTLWSYSAYHFYLFYVVISQYYVLKELQEPTFIVMPYAYP